MDNGSRYVGLDVHRDTISVAVCDSGGELMLERVIPTSAAAVLELLELLRGKLHVLSKKAPRRPRSIRRVTCNSCANNLRTRVAA